MYRIIDGRGTGKTRALMVFAKDTGAKVACSNPEAMRRKAEAYGIIGVDFIPYSDLFTKKYGHDKIVIDEVESLLHNCTDGRLIGYTLSNED